MRHIFTLWVLALIAAACAAPAAPTATPSAIPTTTETPPPSPTSPPTLTPSPTIDPNMPKDATGRDASTGEYTKRADGSGRTLTYIWKTIQFGNDVENGVVGHWFESRMAKGPIDLTGYGENAHSVVADFPLPLNVYSAENLRDLAKVGYMYHPDGQSDYIKNGYQNFTVASQIVFDLFLRYFDLLPAKTRRYERDHNLIYMDKYSLHLGTNGPNQQLVDDWRTFKIALNGDGAIHVGGDLWQPRKGYDVYWIDEAAAKADPSMHLANDLYWKVMVKDHRLIAILGTSQWVRTIFAWPKQGSREGTFRSLTLFPLQAMINGQNPAENTSWLPYQDYGNFAGPDVTFGGVPMATSFIAFVPTP